MGELVTFTPKTSAKGTAGRSGLPATIVIFPGVRYERESERRKSQAAGQEKSGAAEGVKA
jgi:hypothetical protein